MSAGLFHFTTEPLSRRDGRNVVASAAYVSATALRCERTGNVYDYGRAHRVAHSEILTHADAPTWARERSSLWNAAEAREKRSDSRVGRSFEAAIPNGLTRDQQVDLVRGFIQAELVDQHGVAADFSIHDEDPKPGRVRNPHWHATTSHRAILAEGFAAKVCDVLNKEAELMRLREAWATHTNRALERAGIDVRIDHRSYADQGIDKIPQIHEGPAARAIERAGGISDRCEENRRIAARNRRLKQLRDRGRQLNAWWKATKERFAQALVSKPALPTADRAPKASDAIRDTLRRRADVTASQQPQAAAGPKPATVPAPKIVVPPQQPQAAAGPPRRLPSHGPKPKVPPQPSRPLASPSPALQVLQATQVPHVTPVTPPAPAPDDGFSDEQLAWWQQNGGRGRG